MKNDSVFSNIRHPGLPFIVVCIISVLWALLYIFISPMGKPSSIPHPSKINTLESYSATLVWMVSLLVLLISGVVSFWIFGHTILCDKGKRAAIPKQLTRYFVITLLSCLLSFCCYAFAPERIGAVTSDFVDKAFDPFFGVSIVARIVGIVHGLFLVGGISLACLAFSILCDRLHKGAKFEEISSRLNIVLFAAALLLSAATAEVKYIYILLATLVDASAREMLNVVGSNMVNAAAVMYSLFLASMYVSAVFVCGGGKRESVNKMIGFITEILAVLSPLAVSQYLSK